ncbi:MAG: hypothetical protein WA130_19295 [Candidatus Methanoperedens sp.]
MRIIIKGILFFILMIVLVSAWRYLTVTPGSPGSSPGVVQEPIKLHPDNNHYFLYNGKPTILIGSNEHYGAVLNLDFDYDIYLNELQSKGLNYVRIFSGTYIEPNPNMGSWWDIDDNTLAPTNNGFISPWARSTTKGFAGDSNSYKFDLSRWDTEYFNRLRDFVGKADSKGIVVEYVFFCPFWSKDDKKAPLPNMWARSPMNIINNINNVGATASWDNDGYDMVWDVRAGNHNGGLTPYMDNMVTKVVQELNEFDNVIFQSGIETYKGDGNGGNSDPAVTMETVFEDYINSKIVAADTPKKHLISQNRDAAWGTTKNIKNGVSVLSWDAGDKSDIVAKFYNLNKPLSNDEFAYGGRGEVQYRRAGWKWIIDGGAIFDMLDLSFTPYRGEEAGTKIMPNATSTGGTRLLGGSAAIRTQLGILNDFIHSFNFVKMTPNNSILTSGAPSGTRALVETGKQYAIYLPAGKSANLIINLPAGNYKADWVNTKTGNIDKTEDIVGHTGGNRALLSPGYSEDIALRILSSALQETPTTSMT